MIDPPADGGRNMAVDEALLKSADETGQTTLRFYQWAAPTLSLGYFQKSVDRRLHLPSSQSVWVRRSSGGGAILHDHELTYSLALPGTNRWSSKHNDLYGSVHSAIVKFLNEHGVLAHQFEVNDEFSVNSGRVETTDDIPFEHQKRFLCFQRRTAGDIILNGCKIGGSAQRRLSNATLQHGSLLLRRSNFAPELPGIADLADFELSFEEFTQGLLAALARQLNLSLKRANLTKKQEKIVSEIQAQKYDNPQWTGKK